MLRGSGSPNAQNQMHLDGQAPEQHHHQEAAYLGGVLEFQVPSKCLHGVFNHENLVENYKRLDQYYQEKLTPDSLDDRHFISREIRNLTPVKMSPFARTNQLHNKH